MTNRAFDDLENKICVVFGISPESMGKTQVRQQFLPLVAALNSKATVVEITDHDKPVAMLLSYSHWLALISKLSMLSGAESAKQTNDLVGSVEIVGDLEAASKRIANKFKRSFKNL